MASFVEVFKQSEKLARSLNHPVVTLDHLSSCVLELESVSEFLNHIKIDSKKLKVHVNNWLRDVQYPELSDAIKQQQVEQGGNHRVPFSPILSRVQFELSKQSVIEQLKRIDNEEHISSYFMLFECLSFPESAITNALELMGFSSDNVCRELQDYASQKNSSLSLNVQLTDSEEDYEEEIDMDEDGDNIRPLSKAIRSFTTDLNALASSGKLDKLIGRDNEVADLIQTLSRKNKKNAVLVGEAGVGKTQIVDGLVSRIVSGDVPEYMKDARILSLNLAALTAGTKFRGELEERVDALIKEISGRDDIILFIDEMHNIMSVGGGNGGGSMDFGNMLKPALSRGEIRVIGATTYAEYRSVIEADTAISRRFTKIDVVEPSLEDTRKIVKGIKNTYEKYHGVKISNDTFDSIIEYSQKYLQNKRFPDKAIDLMDSASARKKIKATKGEVIEITREDVAYEVSRVANIPLEVITCSESTRMMNLSSTLKKRVFGQDTAIDTLVKNVMVARAGLRDKSSVQGAFLFVGPSGTGKTELSKALADSMGVELIRFDMSEFSQEHTASKLIGSPPGYVGHDSGNGALLDKVDQYPNCVLLLDEIEKAHPKVLLTFLQVLDEGRLTGSKNKTVFFNNVTVIMTTNLGARDGKVFSTGMNSSSGDGMDKAIKQFLPPEFINRLDSTVKFHDLPEEVVLNVVDKQLAIIREEVKKRKITIKLNKAAKVWLAKNGVTPGMGARPLKRLIAENVSVPLSYEMLCGRLVNGGEASFGVVDDKLVLLEPKVRAVKVKSSESEDLQEV